MLKACSVLILALQLIVNTTNAQPLTWRFGNLVGLQFPGPLSSPGSYLNSGEGSSVITDNSGNLFYTDGTKLWKNTSATPIGTGLMGNASSTQSAIIIPQTSSNCSKYWLFTTPGWETNAADGLRYSIFNTTGVTTTNILLQNSVCEKLAAIAKPYPSTGFYVIAHGFGNNTFYVYSVNSSSISSPQIFSVGTSATTNGQQAGQMKISPDGKKIAVAYYGYIDPAFNPTTVPTWGKDGFVQVFDFNPVNGIISGPTLTINNVMTDMQHSGPYGIEFSPSSENLYFTTNSANVAGQRCELYEVRFQPCSTTPLVINGWAQLLTYPWAVRLAQGASSSGVSDANNRYYFGALQISPDKKIYAARYNQSNLGVINSPDAFPATYGNSPVLLSPGTSKLGLPTVIQGDYTCSDSCHCPKGWLANMTNVDGGSSPDRKCKKQVCGPFSPSVPPPSDGTAIGTWGFTWGDGIWVWGTSGNGGSCR